MARRIRLSVFIVLAALLGGGFALPVVELQPPAQAAVQAPASAARTLTIRQLDVGQGDAALLTTSGGRRILIDAGPDADDVANMLAAGGVDTLDLVIASHNHADHIGGMRRVLDAFAVRAYVENGIPQPTATYRRTLAALEVEPGLLFLRASDRTITVGDVQVHILAAPGADDSQNNNSVGVMIEHGAFRALYTGDSEVPELTGWLRQWRIPRVTLVKVAHHGSGNGTTPAWVRATSPELAVISVGARNSYGHPAPQAVLQWASAGAQVLRTDRHGTIEIVGRADGRFTIRTSRQPGGRR